MDKSGNRAIMAKVVSGRVICPVCNRQTMQRVLLDTEMKNFPLHCKKCGKVTVISVSLSRRA